LAKSSTESCCNGTFLINVDISSPPGCCTVPTYKYLSMIPRLVPITEAAGTQYS
jgi:hypothetical protein